MGLIIVHPLVRARPGAIINLCNKRVEFVSLTESDASGNVIAGIVVSDIMPSMKSTMKEYEGDKLRSGSKKGPVVTNRKQAIAIGLSEAGKSNAKGGKKK